MHAQALLKANENVLHPGAPAVWRPNAFLIGAPKCATTSAAQALDGHDKVFLPYIKEPGFFGSDFPAEVSGEAEYRALYDAAPATTQVRLDASVQYLASKDAIAQIMAFEPAARIICVFRDPLEVAPAYHAQLRRHFAEPIEQFDAAWADLPNRHARRAAGHEWEPLYDHVCFFGKHLKRLREQVPESQLAVIMFNDLISEPGPCLDRLQDFLGLQRQPLSLPHANKNREIANRGLYHMQYRLARAAGWMKARTGLRRNFGLMRGLSAMTSRLAQRDTVSPETLAAMKSAFAEDVALFETLTGQRLRGPLWEAGEAGRRDT